MTDISPLKSSENFVCSCCDYTTSKKSQYDRHMATPKHKNTYKLLTNTYTEELKSSTNVFTCECGSIYKHRQSLYTHKKKCKNNEPEISAPQSNDLFIQLLNQNMELIKQNQEFKEMLVDQNKSMFEIAGKAGGTHNTNCNNTNNFNLQIFLNETCKDALNIDEFVNQIQLQLSDLDMIGKVGYVEGITKIFLRNLKALDVCKRPIHCSDLKREVLYIKDKGAWEKDNDDNVKIKKVIKGIEDKNIKQLPQWRAENPTHEDTETKKHMEYVHILIESMGGTPIEDDNKRLEKIIRNIAKEVVIDKHH